MLNKILSHISDNLCLLVPERLKQSKPSVAPLFGRSGPSAGSEPAPSLEPLLWISTTKELALGQENWFQSGTSNVLVEDNEGAEPSQGPTYNCL